MTATSDPATSTTLIHGSWGSDDVTVTVVVNWRAREGEEECVAAALEVMTTLTQAEEGCIHYCAHQSNDDRREFLLFEQYMDPAAFQKHQDSDHFKQHVRDEALPRLESNTVTCYTVIDCDQPIPEPDSLRLIYQEVCKSHGAIADFRAKLLALLPLASGAGVSVLLNSGLATATDPSVLIGIGLFGFAVTFGLFMYELRGIQDCTMLRDRAEELEKRLHIAEDRSQFGGRSRGGLGGLVDEMGAAWIVYPAVLASWLYVAGTGAELGWRYWPWLLVAVYLGILIVLVSRWRWAARSGGGQPFA